jgi:hypothetical protein
VGIGALLGLGITFAATSSLDGIPPDDVAQPKTTRRSVGPTFAPVVGLDGLTRTMLGVSGTLR